MNAQKRYEKLDNITGCCWIDLQSNHTWMFAKREDYPITKMFIKCNENPIFINRCLQYLLIIRSILARLRRHAQRRDLHYAKPGLHPYVTFDPDKA